MPDTNNILTVENLEITLNAGTPQQRPVVRALNLRVEAGQMTALVGGSGCGKTMTALAIAGLLPDVATVTAGSVSVCGCNVLQLRAGARRTLGGSRISMIFQEPSASLNPLVPVGKQIAESVRIHRHLSEKQAYPLVRDAMRRAGLSDCEKIYGYYPHQLSGGLCQRVMIALALVCGPSLLIADEPTTALDACVQHEILQQIKTACAGTGTAVLYISHDLETVAGLCSSVAVMQDGAIVETGDVNTIFANPGHPYTQMLVAAIPSQQRKTVFRKSDEVILSVDNVKKIYTDSGKTVLDGVSLAVHKSEIVGLVGESGCGKTTLARCITGLDTSYTGLIRYHGIPLQQRTGRSRRKRSRYIQMVFQNPVSALNPRRTVRQILEEPLAARKLGTAAERQKKVYDMLQLTGLEPEYADRYRHELSGGQKQRVAIGSALMLSPDILVADEPVSALDPAVQTQILDLLRYLNRTLGISILFISHNLSVVHSFCDTIAVMHNGAIIEKGNADEVFFSPQHSYTKHLISAGRNFSFDSGTEQ